MGRRISKRAKRGQFLILAAIVLIVTMLLLSNIYNSAIISRTEYLEISFREITQKISIDFPKALSSALANSSLTYKATDDPIEAQSNVEIYLANWRRNILVKYAGLGVKLNVSDPTVELDWTTSQSYSSITATVELALTTLGFSGWNDTRTVTTSITIPRTSDTPAVTPNTLSFNMTALREDGSGIATITNELLEIKVHYVGGSTVFNDLNMSNAHIIYYGDGLYNVTAETEGTVDAFQVFAYDDQGIVVGAMVDLTVPPDIAIVKSIKLSTDDGETRARVKIVSGLNQPIEGATVYAHWEGNVTIEDRQPVIELTDSDGIAEFSIPNSSLFTMNDSARSNLGRIEFKVDDVEFVPVIDITGPSETSSSSWYDEDCAMDDGDSCGDVGAAYANGMGAVVEYYGYDFNIPPSTKILNVWLRLDTWTWRCTFGCDNDDELTVEVTYDGVTSPVDLQPPAESSEPTPSDTYPLWIQLNSTDPLGWNVTQLENANFYFTLTKRTINNWDYVYLDFIPIVVLYQPNYRYEPLRSVTSATAVKRGASNFFGTWSDAAKALSNDTAKASATLPPSEAAIVYSINTSNSPQNDLWDGSSWNIQPPLTSAGSPVRWVRVAYNPTPDRPKDYVSITLSEDGYLDAYIWNGSQWLVTNNIGNITYAPPETRPYDIAYERSDGDAVLVHGVNSSDPSKDLAYKIWSGSSWSSEQYIDYTDESEDVVFSWVELASNMTGSSNVLGLVAFDSVHNYTVAWRWNGTSFVDQYLVTDEADGTDGSEAFGVAFEELSGDLLAVSAEGSAGEIRFATYSEGGWQDGGTLSIGSGSVLWITLKPDPVSNSIMGTFVTSNGNLYTVIWNGTSWNTPILQDSSLDSQSPSGKFFFTENPGPSSTSSTSFQDFVTLTFTPEESGNYTIIATAELAGSSRNRWVEAILEIDGSVYSQTYFRPRIASVYHTQFASFKLLDLDTTPHTAKIRWRKVTGGSSVYAYIRNGRLAVFPVSNYTLGEFEASQSVTISWSDKLQNNFVADGSDYLFIASADVKLHSTSYSVRTRLRVNGVDYHEAWQEARSSGEWKPWFVVKKFDDLSGSVTSSIQARTEGGGSSEIKNLRILAIKLPDEFVGVEYSEDASYTQNSGISYQDKLSLDFTPSDQSEWLVLASVLVSGDASTSSNYRSYFDLTIDEVEEGGEMIFGFKDDTDRVSLGFVRKQIFTDSSHSIKWRYHSRPWTNPDAGMRDARIIALRIPAEEAENLTRPADFEWEPEDSKGLLVYGTNPGKITWKSCGGGCESSSDFSSPTDTDIGSSTDLHLWIQLRRNPGWITDSDADPMILGAVLDQGEGSFQLGAVWWNGIASTKFVVIDDSPPFDPFTSDVTLGDYETFEIEFQLQKSPPTETYYDFGFSIPSEAIIDYLDIQLDLWLEQSGNDYVNISLSSDAGDNWASAQPGEAKPLLTTEDTYHINATVWSRWNPDDLNANDLWVRIIKVTNASSEQVNLEYLAVYIEYHIKPTLSPPFMHIDSITLSQTETPVKTLKGDVKIFNAKLEPIPPSPGVTVNITITDLSNSSSWQLLGTTGSNGIARFTLDGVEAGHQYQLAVNNVTKTDWIYDPDSDYETSKTYTVSNPN